MSQAPSVSGAPGTSAAPGSSSATFSPPLNSRGLVVLTGMSYCGVGLAFSYLDRRYGFFGLEALLWTLWALLGFGAGAWQLGKPGDAGKTIAVAMAVVAALVLLVPGLVMYSLQRWTSLALMLAIGARAAQLRTRRDFYLALCVVFSVSFMVGSHGNADWTLWFYLGPAWVCAALALAWDHAADAGLSRAPKAAMTLGFVGAAFGLAVLLFFFAPRPPILGFGFLPPGTDTPGLFTQPGAGRGTQSGPGGGGGSTQADGSTNPGAGGHAQPGSWAQQWDAMLRGMRQSASDPSIPQWQRSLMRRGLDWAQRLHGWLTGQPFVPPPESADASGQEAVQLKPLIPKRIDWLQLLLWALFVLLLAGLAFALWHRRHRLGVVLLLSGAALLANRYPARSMQLSARAMKWVLQLQGHPQRPGQSVREHFMSALHLPPLVRHWLRPAVDSYCAMRFGRVPATPLQATHMRQAVQAAFDIANGLMPELAV